MDIANELPENSERVPSESLSSDMEGVVKSFTSGDVEYVSMSMFNILSLTDVALISPFSLKFENLMVSIFFAFRFNTSGISSKFGDEEFE